jgi:hypothetical protein
MPADILSLSKVRKARARAAKEQQATQNRAHFGRTKAEKRLQKAQDKRINQTLDGAQLSVPGCSETPPEKA